MKERGAKVSFLCVFLDIRIVERGVWWRWEFSLVFPLDTLSFAKGLTYHTFQVHFPVYGSHKGVGLRGSGGSIQHPQ